MEVGDLSPFKLLPFASRSQYILECGQKFDPTSPNLSTRVLALTLRACHLHSPQRVEHVTARLEIRTAEAEAMEAEELQNALNQPPDGPAAAAAAGGDPAGAGAGAGPSDESGASEVGKCHNSRKVLAGVP